MDLEDPTKVPMCTPKITRRDLRDQTRQVPQRPDFPEKYPVMLFGDQQSSSFPAIAISH